MKATFHYIPLLSSINSNDVEDQRSGPTFPLLHKKEGSKPIHKNKRGGCPLPEVESTSTIRELGRVCAGHFLLVGGDPLHGKPFAQARTIPNLGGTLLHGVEQGHIFRTRGKNHEHPFIQKYRHSPSGGGHVTLWCKGHMSFT